MSLRIVTLAVILQVAFGLRKNVDIDVVSQIEAGEHGKRNTSAEAVRGPFTQKAIRTRIEDFERSTGYHRFELVEPGVSTMNSLGLGNEWKALLENLNDMHVEVPWYQLDAIGGTHWLFKGPCPDRQTCKTTRQNAKGKEIVAEFNKQVRESGKAPGWYLTFYSRYTLLAPSGAIDRYNGRHYLTWRPETDTTYVERSSNPCQTWDRACCCRPEPNQAKCEYAWSQNKCCKFKYGNIEKNGCKIKSGSWNPFSSAKSVEKVDDAQCFSGPQKTAPPVEHQFWQYVDNIYDEPNDDGVGTLLPKSFYTGKRLTCADL